MTSALEINGKKLSSIKEAVSATKYTRDYIARLAREGKIVASSIGRQWFIDLDSLRSYSEIAALEQEARKRQLSEARKHERQVRMLVEKSRALRHKKADSLNRRALVVAMVVLCSGLVGGFVTYEETMVIPVKYNEAFFAQLPLSPKAELMPAQTSGARSGDQFSTADLEQIEKASSLLVPMSSSTEGVLLFPSSGSVENVTELFSDVVEVQKTADGKKVVVMVDAAGNQIGNEVPFLIVPVTESKR